MNNEGLIEQYDCNELYTKRIDLLENDSGMDSFAIDYPGQAFYYPKYD